MTRWSFKPEQLQSELDPVELNRLVQWARELSANERLAREWLARGEMGRPGRRSFERHLLKVELLRRELSERARERLQQERLQQERLQQERLQQERLQHQQERLRAERERSQREQSAFLRASQGTRSERFLVATAVRLLPPSKRDRYLEEFRAELLDVQRDTRLRHAWSLLRGVIVLRLHREL